MGPKPTAAKSKSRTGAPIFTEIERAYYELQVADCNRRVARLRSSVDGYEVRYEELQKAIDKLDEDRADIIAFLKKTLHVKNEENTELKEKVKVLEELRVIETASFKETITELEYNFTRMKDQLTSENKLQAGKLNALEEFRAIRDDLMKKYDRQQVAFADQEIKYKKLIYDTEKKLVIGKDKLKKEMEDRLQKLAQEFQDASELRIAAATHKVIQENIALNNQLDTLLMTQAKVAEQNEKSREDERASRCAMEVAEEERDKAIGKSMAQLRVIDQLTAAFEDTKKQKAVYNKKLYDQDKMQTKVQRLAKENKNLLLHARILEQNLHATLGYQNKSAVETAKLLRERETFKQILKDSACAVQASLKMDDWSTLDRSSELMARKVVLIKILDVINRYRDATEAVSTDSLVSLSNIYDKGDLGLEVKPAPSKKLQKSMQLFEDKRSVAVSALSPVSSRKESIRTVPSIQLIPVDEESLTSRKASIPSFTVTSLHSSVSSTVEEEEAENEKANVSRMLADSKLEVQKSLLADLALSNLPRISHQRISASDTTNLNSSMVTAEKRESADNIDVIQHESIPEKDNEPTNVEPTHDEPTQGTDETVNQDNEQEKKEG